MTTILSVILAVFAGYGLFSFVSIIVRFVKNLSYAHRLKKRMRQLVEDSKE